MDGIINDVPMRFSFEEKNYNSWSFILNLAIVFLSVLIGSCFLFGGGSKYIIWPTVLTARGFWINGIEQWLYQRQRRVSPWKSQNNS